MKRKHFTVVWIGDDARHGHSYVTSFTDVESELARLAFGGNFVSAVVVGPSGIGAGVTTAIASLVTLTNPEVKGALHQFEFLQPQDRKQAQLWRLDEAKERNPEAYAAAAAMITRPQPCVGYVKVRGKLRPCRLTHNHNGKCQPERVRP